jgi:subfamily B ATP-binding cassette protein HlyB/CyaB
MLRIIKDAGFKCRLKHLKAAHELSRICSPLMLLHGQECHVLLKMDQGRFLVLHCLEKKVVELDEAALSACWDGRIIMLTPRAARMSQYLSVKWLLKEFFKHRAIFYEILSASLIIQIFALVSPLFMQVIIDKVLPHEAVTTLQLVAAAFVGIALFEAGLSMVRSYLLYHTANKIDAGLGSRIFRHLLSLPYRYFETRKVGSIIAKVRELENLRQFMTQFSLTVLLDVLFSFVFIAVMVFYSLPLTVITLCFIAVIVCISAVATPVVKRRLEDKFEKGALSNSFLVEAITGIQTIKSLAIEGSMVRRWESLLGEYIYSGFSLSNVGNIAQSLSSLVQRTMTLGVIYFGVGYVFDNVLTIGQLIAFQMFASQLSGPLMRLVQLWQGFQQAKLSLDRLGDIVNTPPDITGGEVALQSLRGEIVFKDVCFRYAGNGPLILDKVNLQIMPGRMVGIVGRSGSGKSTLVKLLQRLYIPQEGGVFVDGLDIRNVDPLSLRFRLGVVPQDCFLFSGTIRENIALAAPNSSMETIVQACMLAGAHEFISELPLGYNTVVEERGASLSGGQRQRIAIARALITNPGILIFDEATSALDYESERILQKNLDHIRAGRTVIMVAHRLSVMARCDQVVVMEKGHIVEVGSHAQLLEKKGLYHYLHQQQNM